MAEYPWLAEMRPASVRGVPLHVLDRSLSGGRRGPDHEFAQRDVPEAQDVGRKQRSLSVQAVVVPDDSGSYIAGRDRLIGALEAYGPGLYVDPWGGEWSVACRSYNLKEGRDFLGVAYFDIQFTEAGEARFPASAADTRAAVDSAARATSTAAVADFDGAFDLADQPGFVIDSLTGTAGLVLEATAQAFALPEVGVDLTAAADLALSLDGARGAAGGLLRDGFAAQLADILGQALGVHGAGAAWRIMAGLGTATGRGAAPGITALSDLEPVPLTTPSRRRQAAMRDQLIALPGRLAVAEEARALARQEFASQDEAAAARAATLGRLDAVRAIAAGRGDGFADGTYRALGELRRTVVEDVAARAVNLPRLRRAALAEPLPAVVAAYRLTGDPRRMDDLIARNRVWHPSWVPATDELEILP